MKAHEFYGLSRTGCRFCGQMPDHPLHNGVDSHVEHYTHAELREAISILLSYVDKTLPEGFHDYGQTADWFVAAASMTCNVPSSGKSCVEILRELNDIEPSREEIELTIEVS